MDGKEIARQFKAAAWRSQEEIERFLLSAEDVPAAEIAKLLPLLADRSLAADPRAHRHRTAVFVRMVENSRDPALFVPVTRALKTLDPQGRVAVAAVLPKVNALAGHGELAALLRQQDSALRKVAAQVMRQLGGKSIFELAVDLLRDPDLPGRAEALEVAATVGGYHAIPALEQVVLSPRISEKVLALRFLGDVRLMARDVPRALQVIARALSDTNEQVAVQAVSAYGALCSEDELFEVLGPAFDSPNTAVVRAAVESVRRFDSPRAIEALERKFRMGPNPVRIAVLNVAENIGNDAVLPILAEALKHKQQAVRNRAADVLSTLSLNKRINLGRTLLWLLRSRDVNVRRIAVDLAKKVGDPMGELWPSLLGFLRDEDWWVRERVMDALVEMAGTQLTRHVVSYLQDPSDVVRRYAVDVLLRLKDPAALGVLVRSATGDGDWWVRERALEAIGKTGDPRAIPYVVDLLARQPELRVACLATLADLKAASAAPQIAALLSSEDADVRHASIECLSRLDDPSQAQAVSGCLADPEYRIRVAARAVLDRWRYEYRDDVAQGTRSSTVLDRLLTAAARAEGDDLIIAAGRVPYIKRLGQVAPLATTPFTPEQLRELLGPHLTAEQVQTLESRRDIDFSYEVKAEGLRFRANVFMQNTGLAAVFRVVKDNLLSIEQLGLPPVVQSFGDLKNGLVLVGGPTGSGKSTTLAAIIDYINRTNARHIITLEDPIEVVHTRKMSLVNQRELGTHTRSFSAALRAMLREDPNVILVGEMRDLATISFAVSAAETGHLVFGTLHTVSADTTVDRLINAFPPGQQAQVRAMLAESLRAVVCQHLLRRIDKPGRVAAVEIMINNDAISNLMRKGKAFQIPSIIATQRDSGMQTMDAELKRLVKDAVISADEAYMKANNKKDMEEFLAELAKTQGKAVAGAAAGPGVLPGAGVPLAAVAGGRS